MKIVNVLIIVLLIGSSFLFGIMVNYTPKPDLINQVKYSVIDYLSYPESASFKNIKYNFVRETSDKGELGYVCGEVFRVKDERLEGYKKFAVKVYNNPNGRMDLSIPLVEGDDSLPLSVVNSLWNKYCN
ncbi:hypothetical protein [Providencia sneebia]|uniref:Uncharacterized protein n=1 Tax=Providencia sneebia DSM 19967 TaxID=1141660 RepID=K8WIK4_9GAMM|nr:hypothetical protein [Providencia sneebia]EKT57327.1 hypothetical protein OO7_08060 [Providencia sneebia DSM 19967]